ncbi:putative gp43 [Burkholderia pseudomallei TSV28]|nr:putative gp43 [Burkholderia pseudomallei TSV28]
MNDQQQSRADALTKLVESYGHALIKQRNEEASAILEMIHRFAASSAEHPAAAPIIPTPADKRAAFEAWWTRDVPIEYRSMLPLLLQRNAKGEYDNPRCEGAWEIWQASAAASPAAESDSWRGLTQDDRDLLIHVLPEHFGLDRSQQMIDILVAPQPAPPDAFDEETYVAKRMAETLATIYTTIIGDDPVDSDDGLNAIERVVRAAQVLRLEVDLYRAQADAPAHAAECPHCDGEGVIEGDSGTSPCACQRDAQEGMPTFGARRAQADAPAEARERDDPELIAASNKGYAAGLRDGKALGACGPLAPADAGEAAAWRYRTSGDNWCYCDGDPVHVCDRDYEKQPLYTAPPAARMASLTNSQREAIEFAAKTMEARMLNAHACVLRALLNGADKS